MVLTHTSGSTLRGTWHRDPVWRLVVVVHGLLWLGLAVGPPWPPEGISVLWEVVQLAAFLLCVLHGFGARAAAERPFWRFMALGACFWFGARILDLIGPRPIEGTLVGVVVDSLFLAFYLSLIFAADSRPDRVPRWFQDIDRQLNLWGGVTFAFALLFYFVHIPSHLELEVYASGRMSNLLQLGLDVFLFFRFLHLAWSTPAVRWRWIYGLCGAALATLAWLDLGSYIASHIGQGLMIRPLLEPPDSEPWTAWGLWPWLFLMLAARIESQGPEAPATTSVRGAWRQEALGPLVLYAFAFPLMHLLLHYFGADSPQSHGPRDLLVVVYFVIVGALAIWQFRLRDEARRRAEQQLRESEDSYRQLLESSGHAIVVLREGMVLTANSPAAELFGLEGLPVPMDFETLGLPTPPVDASSLRAGELCRTRAASDGREVELLLTYHTIQFHGEPAWQMVARDMSRLGELRLLTRRLRRLAALGEFAAHFTEELHRPLEALDRHRRSLDTTELGPDDQMTLTDIELAIERMEKIVSGISDFSNLADPRVEETDLVPTIDSAIRTLHERYPEDRREVRRAFHHGGARVQVDVDQIVQVLVNLLDNAHQAMAGDRPVTVETHSDQDSVVLSIIDSGDGIAADQLERIFDPFYTTRNQGTGLGLAVVSRILEKHHCWHAVESEVGVGTRFTLSFPRVDNQGGAW